VARVQIESIRRRATDGTVTGLGRAETLDLLLAE
jgi:hypothetical protein